MKAMNPLIPLHTSVAGQAPGVAEALTWKRGKSVRGGSMGMYNKAGSSRRSVGYVRYDLG